MAKRKLSELSPEAQAANEAGEAQRAGERKERIRNKEKQQRFRESMKAEGYKQVTFWVLSCPPGVRERMAKAGFKQGVAWEKPDREGEKPKAVKVKVSAAVRETSIGAAEKSPEVQKALLNAANEFLNALGGGKPLSKEAQSFYSDYLELIKPLGDPWGEE